MAEYRRPDVYIEEEISSISVQEIESAVPVFIGCTEVDPGIPVQISSMEEYKTHFGKPTTKFDPEYKNLTIDEKTYEIKVEVEKKEVKLDYFLYYAMQLYFDNGGGKCFVISNGAFPESGKFDPTAFKDNLETNLDKAFDIEEVTLIVVPEITNLVTVLSAEDSTVNPPVTRKSLDFTEMKTLIGSAATKLTVKKKYEKFFILDVADAIDPEVNNISSFDQSDFMSISTSSTGEGGFMAFYYPNLITTYRPDISDEVLEKLEVGIIKSKTEIVTKSITKLKEGSLKEKAIVDLIKSNLKGKAPNLILPPSAAMAGIYFSVDNTRNVWKAPANVGINGVKKLNQLITDELHEDLNINPLNQRSICAIRNIPGYGIKVMGARTLRGSSNDFRYINVRRTTSVFEKSIKNALKLFLFEPNNSDTWAFAKATIENYLYEKWEQGALYGAKQDQAFFVRVGLGVTMNGQDVLNGKMIVEIGLAIVRPAEFIILRFEQILPQA